MAIKTIDHDALVALSDTGIDWRAHVVSQDGGWTILVKHGTTEHALAMLPGRPVRVFRKFDTLVAYLKKFGITRFDVDAGDDGGLRPKADRSSPDLAYTQWLIEQVDEAIDDTSPTVPHDEAMRQVRNAIKLA